MATKKTSMTELATMSLTELAKVTPEKIENARLENMLVDARFNADAGTLSLKQQISTKQREIADAKRVKNDVATEIVQKRMDSGYDYQREVDYFVKLKDQDNKISTLEKEEEYLNGILNYMNALNTQLLA